MNILDYITKIDRDDISIHLPPEFLRYNTECLNAILLISHELTRTGAPIQLLMLAKTLSVLGYQPFVYSLSGGDLIEEFIKIGIPVICGFGPAQSVEWINELVRDFNCIFINSLQLSEYVRYLSISKKHIFWWIHESSFMFSESDCIGIPKSKTLKILAASEKCSDSIRKYLNIEPTVLNICVEDQGISSKEPSKKTVFLWAGTLDLNKAPDILLKAILNLPFNYIHSSEFIFVGHAHNNNKYAELIKTLALKLPNTYFMDAMDHGDFLQLMDLADSVVVTSLEETMNTVAIEGLMKGKIVVCTNGCGNTRYIENDKTGFVFPVRDYQKLSEIIKYIIDNNAKLDYLRKAGRNIYESYFTFNNFKQNIEKLLNNSQ